MTNKAEAVVIDDREPTWIQNLKFGGIPASIMRLDAGDVQVVTSDGAILSIERKTPDDLLNSLKDDRLLPQCARLVQDRIDDQISGKMTHWPYLVITGPLTATASGKVITPERGETAMSYAAVQGALLSIQEMGVMVAWCANDYEFEATVLRLSERKRDEMFLLPPRIPTIVGPGAAFLASLPGIGIERCLQLMNWGNNVPAHILSALTDLELEVPGIGLATKKKIRSVLGLKDGEVLASPMFDEKDREIITVLSSGG